MITIMSIELIDFLQTCPHRVREIPVGSTLFWREERVRNLYVVDTGIIELRRCTEDGSCLILQRAGSKSILAEASVYSRSYHCDAVVTEAARLLEFSKPKFLGCMTQIHSSCICGVATWRRQFKLPDSEQKSCLTARSRID